MMRNLLAARLGLKIRTQTKVMQVYALVPAAQCAALWCTHPSCIGTALEMWPETSRSCFALTAAIGTGAG